MGFSRSSVEEEEAGISFRPGGGGGKERRGIEGKKELTFVCLPVGLVRSQKSISRLLIDLTSTFPHRIGAVSENTSKLTLPRTARVEGSACWKMRTRTSQGKRRREASWRREELGQKWASLRRRSNVELILGMLEVC